MQITYSAPSSIILAGFLGISYCKPVLAMAPNSRTTFTIYKGTQQTTDRPIDGLAQFVCAYLKKKSYPFTKKTFSYEIKNGDNSTALYVAATAALLEFFTDKSFAVDEINVLAYSFLKKQDIYGVQTSTSSYGGFIYFRKEFEFLKSIHHLPFNFPRNVLQHLYLMDIGQTLKIDEKVKLLFKTDPNKAEKVLNDLEKITKRLVVSILKEDALFFKQTLEQGSQLLSSVTATDISHSIQSTFLRNSIQMPIGKFYDQLLIYSDEDLSFESGIQKLSFSHEGVKREK